jgi:MoaA/NifB/PqqE/SkfB family radical SAM enzyme
MKKDMIFKLIEKHTDIAFQVYTNSLLLTREDLARIVKAANTGLAISVEGLEAETDNRRGKGSWVRIMENLQEIKRLGGIGAFSVTGTSQNLEEILSEKFMQTMIDAGCLYGWYLMYVPVGTRAVPELMPSPAQRLYLVKQVEELRRRFPILLGMFWNDGNILEGCMSPKKYIHINSRGDAEACVFMHFSTHNIREHSYLEILRSPYFQKLRDRQPYNGDPRRPCPVTDNPHIFRDILRETKPRPTEPEAEKILTDFAPLFDRYAEEYKQLLDKENAEAACGGGCGCHSQDKA